MRRRGRNLILVSLPGEKLASVKEALEALFPVGVQHYKTDLTLPGAPE
jgi:short-subunit dehydrogenase